MSFLVSREAQADLAEAVSFYKERASVTVANAFITEFERAANVIGASPELGTPTARGRRIFPLRRFPYSLIYTVAGPDVQIWVVAHQRRKPRFWVTRP